MKYKLTNKGNKYYVQKKSGLFNWNKIFTSDSLDESINKMIDLKDNDKKKIKWSSDKVVYQYDLGKGKDLYKLISFYDPLLNKNELLYMVVLIRGYVRHLHIAANVIINLLIINFLILLLLLFINIEFGFAFILTFIILIFLLSTIETFRPFSKPWATKEEIYGIRKIYYDYDTALNELIRLVAESEEKYSNVVETHKEVVLLTDKDL